MLPSTPEVKGDSAFPHVQYCICNVKKFLTRTIDQLFDISVGTIVLSICTGTLNIKPTGNLVLSNIITSMLLGNSFPNFIFLLSKKKLLHYCLTHCCKRCFPPRSEIFYLGSFQNLHYLIQLVIFCNIFICVGINFHSNEK
jgi:hypothetical protein